MRSTIKKKREKKYPTESQTQGKERKGVIKNETSPKIHEIKLGKKKKKELYCDTYMNSSISFLFSIQDLILFLVLMKGDESE